jgi:hypothetical protein
MFILATCVIRWYVLSKLYVIIFLWIKKQKNHIIFIIIFKLIMNWRNCEWLTTVLLFDCDHSRSVDRFSLNTKCAILIKN